MAAPIEDLYRSTFAQAPQPMLLFGPAGARVDLNAAALELLGSNANDGPVLEQISKARAAGSASADLVVQGRHFNVQFIDLAGGAALCVLNAPTKHRAEALEAQLRHAQRQLGELRALVETSSDFVALSRMDGTFTYINAAGRRLAGIEPGESLDDVTIQDLLSPGEFARFTSEVLPALLRTGSWVGEVQLRNRRTGAIELLDNHAFIARDAVTGEPVGLATVARSISLSRALEAQLRQSQRMDALGRFAGGIAHDFNNMLSAILGFAVLIKGSMRPEDPLVGDIDQITRAAERAAALTRQLLAFSRRQMLEPRVLDVVTHLRDMERILLRLLGETVSLELRLGEKVGLVKVDPSQLEQVVLNVVINARDAMPKGGAIRVEAANVDLDAAYVQAYPGLQAGSYVLISITDTGEGMSEEVRQHAFDPFFTTKASGIGTGLGLSTVLGIVQQSGGHVSIDSQLGHGTRVNIHLPTTSEPLVEEPLAKTNETPVGSETVLVVEDEEVVRAFVRTALLRAGYQVVIAKNAQEALQFSEQHLGPVHVLLTDVVMPGENGKQLADKLKQARPDLAVVYMSGYTEDAIVHMGVVDEGTHFLPKPVSPAALLQMIRKVLRG